MRNQASHNKNITIGYCGIKITSTSTLLTDKAESLYHISFTLKYHNIVIDFINNIIVQYKSKISIQLN